MHLPPWLFLFSINAGLVGAGNSFFVLPPPSSKAGYGLEGQSPSPLFGNTKFFLFLSIKAAFLYSCSKKFQNFPALASELVSKMFFVKARAKDFYAFLSFYLF